MKILILNHRGDITTGGVEQWLIGLAKIARRYDIEPYIALPEHGSLEDALFEIGVPVKVIEVAWQPRTLKGWSQYMQGLQARAHALATWIESEKIDLVHTNTLYLFEGALAAMQTCRPHVWHLHSTYGKDTEPYAFGGLNLPLATQTRLLNWLADGILSVSTAAARAFIQNGLAIYVNHNGIDIEAFQARAADYPNMDIRKELGLAPDAPVIANIARVSPEKDLPTYVEACNHIHKALPQTHFLIVGNHSEHAATTAEVRRRIANVGMEHHIHFLGERHDLPAFYPQLNLVMLTSLHEGLSSVLMEAMASGIPTIATRCGGPTDIIEDGRNGLLSEVGDANGLAEAAIRCLTDRDFASALAQAGKKRIAQNFSQSLSLSNLAQYYASIRAHFDPVGQAKRHAMVTTALTLDCLHADIYQRVDVQEKTIRELRNQAEQIPGLNQFGRLRGLLHRLLRQIGK
jgi:glycosyltransferase involved in cell wall biosynthesis